MEDNIQANEILRKENDLMAQHNQDQHVIVINQGQKKAQKKNNQKIPLIKNQLDNQINPAPQQDNQVGHQDNQVAQQNNQGEYLDNEVAQQNNQEEHQDNQNNHQDNQAAGHQDNHQFLDPLHENHSPIQISKILAILSIFVIVISLLPNHSQDLRIAQEELKKQSQINEVLEGELQILRKQLEDLPSKDQIQVNKLQARVKDYQEQLILQKYQVDRQNHELAVCQEALRNSGIDCSKEQPSKETVAIIEEQRKEIIACQDSIKDEILKYLATQHLV